MTGKDRLNRYFGKNDIILLSLIAVFVVALFIIQILFSLNKASIISVTLDGRLYGEYSLEEDQVIPIMSGDERIGEVTVEKGKAYMSYATCPDHLCMKQGQIDSRSQSIVCLPNRIIISVTEGEDPEIDSMTN